MVRQIERQPTRPPLARDAIPRLILVGAIVILGGPELFACSGPGAARIIQRSEQIGWSYAGISIVIVAIGCVLVRRRFPGRRIRWIVAPLAFHPRLWMDAVSGDCGYGLRWWSFVATLWFAVAVALALCWPRPAEAEPKKWRWVLSGALAGTLSGLLIAALLAEGPGPVASTVNLTLAGSVLCSTTIGGALVGGGLFRRRIRGERRFRFSLRTLLLLPVVLAPLFVALLPVLPYQAERSSPPFRFVVVDDATGRPIPNAAVRVLDPRFRFDDAKNQGERIVTGADGNAEYSLYANVQGREGLLGHIETTSYHPLLIRIEAPGYRSFFTSLASEPSALANQFTATPLGLTFPPPYSATIRLTPSDRSESTEGKGDRRQPGP
jgi:hypothetical protein